MPPRDYLTELKRSRYFLLMRGAVAGVKSGLIGQAAIEAAACGCIVLSGHGAYPDRLCHEATYINSKNYGSVARAIQRLQADERLRREVLQHQDIKLSIEFREGPMALLKRLIELKKGRK